MSVAAETRSPPVPETTIHIDAMGDVGAAPTDFAAAAADIEADGYDGYMIPETLHDPFVGLTLASRSTSRIRLASGIAVAFARNPMSVAMLANDLQTLSAGRFVLGLGSQVQAHIERRFSMPWGQPAKRMREFILATRAIRDCWETGGRLDFRGEFFTHTLMTPYFNPGKSSFPPPPIWLAGVGERMTEIAGEVADGFISHAFTTPEYLREVSLPAIRRGQAQSDLNERRFDVCVSAFVAVGETPREIDDAVLATRRQIAFYGSTPAYRAVLERHGRGELAASLHASSRNGDWDVMPAMIDDDLLQEFAVIGTPSDVAAQVRARYEGVATRVSFNAPYGVRAGTWKEVITALRSVPLS